MPRHPPCALHSLSHTPPTQPTPTNRPHHRHRQKKTPPKGGATPCQTHATTSQRQMNQTWQCTQHTTKMLASTIQISNNNPTPTPSPHHMDPRVGRALGTEAPDGKPPDPSEPQQCAPTHTGPGRRTTEGTTNQQPAPDQHHAAHGTRPSGRGNVDDSTSEHHHNAATTEPPADAGTRMTNGVCAP